MKKQTYDLEERLLEYSVRIMQIVEQLPKTKDRQPCCWAIAKGSRKNNFAELALGFGSGLADPREQNHRNSALFRGFYE